MSANSHHFDKYPEHPFLKTEREIQEFLKDCHIYNYQIHSDLTVSTHSKVMFERALDYLPIQFRQTSSFDVRGIGLLSLIGAPQKVVGQFWASKNELYDLVGGPEHVAGAYMCDNNRLLSLKGAPNHVEDMFNCSENHLRSLEFAPLHVGHDFDCSGNPIADFSSFAPHFNPSAMVRFPACSEITQYLSAEQSARRLGNSRKNEDEDYFFMQGPELNTIVEVVREKKQLEATVGLTNIKDIKNDLITNSSKTSRVIKI